MSSHSLCVCSCLYSIQQHNLTPTIPLSKSSISSDQHYSPSATFPTWTSSRGSSSTTGPLLPQMQLHQDALRMQDARVMHRDTRTNRHHLTSLLPILKPRHTSPVCSRNPDKPADSRGRHQEVLEQLEQLEQPDQPNHPVRRDTTIPSKRRHKRLRMRVVF